MIYPKKTLPVKSRKRNTIKPDTIANPIVIPKVPKRSNAMNTKKLIRLFFAFMIDGSELIPSTIHRAMEG